MNRRLRKSALFSLALAACGVLQASSVFAREPSRERVLAESGMKRILDSLEYGRRFAPIETSSGSDASLACMDLVFLDWVGLYSQPLSTVATAELAGKLYDEYKAGETRAHSELSELFEVCRPGVSNAVAQAMSRFRSQKVVPDLPTLTVDDVQEGTLMTTIDFCKTPDLAQEVLRAVAPADVVATVTRTIPVRKSVMMLSDYGVALSQGPSKGGSYVEARVENQSVTKSYVQWLQYIKSGGR